MANHFMPIGQCPIPPKSTPEYTKVFLYFQLSFYPLLTNGFGEDDPVPTDLHEGGTLWIFHHHQWRATIIIFIIIISGEEPRGQHFGNRRQNSGTQFLPSSGPALNGYWNLFGIQGHNLNLTYRLVSLFYILKKCVKLKWNHNQLILLLTEQTLKRLEFENKTDHGHLSTTLGKFKHLHI